MTDIITPELLDKALDEFERLYANKQLGTADCVHGALLAALPDIVEACAWKARSFLVGDPKNGIPLRSPTPHEISEAIEALIPSPHPVNQEKE